MVAVGTPKAVDGYWQAKCAVTQAIAETKVRGVHGGGLSVFHEEALLFGAGVKLLTSTRDVVGRPLFKPLKRSEYLCKVLLMLDATL